jgi:hypothetical protein
VVWVALVLIRDIGETRFRRLKAISGIKPRSVRYASFVGVNWPRQLRRLSGLARFKVFKNITF